MMNARQPNSSHRRKAHRDRQQVRRLTLEWLEDRRMLAALADAYGQLPLMFEANHGQVDSQVDFAASAPGYGLFLTGDSAVLALEGPDDTAVALHMQLVGADPDAQATGQNALPGTSNYLIGNDPNQWYTEIPQFGGVRYEDVWSGIDVVYYGVQGQLEYDFVVDPGAIPDTIQIAFDGADSVSIVDGELVVETAIGPVVQRAPVSYQVIDGVQHDIESRYVPQGTNQVGIQVDSYDANAVLIIDPVVVYSTFLGGTGLDVGNSIAVDASGSAYITGRAGSADFPTTAGVQPTYGGSFADAFVTKLDPSGSTVVYSTFIGGSDFEEGSGIAVDSAGNAFVTGHSRSADFPTTPGAFQTVHGGGPNLQDAFVAKLSATGSALTYSTFIGGAADDNGSDIVVDSSGNALITGSSGNKQIALNDFPTVNAIQGTPPSTAFSAIVTKVDATGSALLFSTFLGGSSGDFGSGIDLDALGHAFVTGTAQSSNFPVTATAFQPVLSTPIDYFADAFIAKLDVSGPALLYSSFLGSGSYDSGDDIAVDSSGLAYITGQTSSSNFPTASPFQAIYGGSRDAFVARFDTSQSGSASLVTSTFLGGSDLDFARSVGLDSSDNIYITGRTFSSDYPTVSPFQGFGTAFVTKFNAGAGTLDYSSKLGGGDQVGSGIAVDSDGNAYVTGQTNSMPTVNPFQAVFGGALDAFVTKIGLAPPPTTEVRLSGTDLIIEDIDGGDTDDTLTLSISGTDLVVADPNNLITTSIVGATGDGTNSVSVPLAAFSGNVVIDTLAGADSVTFDSTFDIGAARGVDLDAGMDTDTVSWDATATLASLDFDAETINLNSGNVNTAGDQSYGGGTVLGATTILTGANMTFNATIDSDATARDLTVNTSGDTEFNGVVGGSAVPNSIKVTSTGGTVDVNAAVNVGAGGLDIDPPDTITVIAPINSAGGPVSLVANNGITLSGPISDVTTNGGTYSVDADADDDEFGLYTQDNAGSAVDTTATTDGAVSITAADVELTGTINAGAGSVSFVPSAVALPVNLGAALDAEFGFAVRAGNTGSDEGLDLALDAAGNVYTTGSFSGTTTFGSTTLTSNGSEDVFIAKQDNDGNYLWAVSAGGSSVDRGRGIAVDGAGNVYVTGRYQGSVAFGGTTLNSGGLFEIFTTKLDTAGNFLWATTAGGSNGDVGREVAVDAAGNVYTTGTIVGTTTFGSIIVAGNSVTDVFIAKQDSAGTYLWAKSAGGTINEEAFGLALDGAANVYVVGNFQGTASFGATILTSVGTFDVFTTKLDTSGNFLWASQGGSTTDGGSTATRDRGLDIALDSAGNVYTTGQFVATANFGATSLTSNGNRDIFVAKQNGTTGAFLSATSAGGTGGDAGQGIFVDGSDNVYTTGQFANTVSFGSTALSSTGGQDVFVTRQDSSLSYQWAKAWGGTSADSGNGIAVDSGGRVYTTGFFQNTADFDPNAGTSNLTSAGGRDIFVSKLAQSFGEFTLTDTEFDNVTTSTKISVGNGSSGDVRFTDHIDMANANTLEIITGGTVNDIAGSTVFTDDNLAIDAAQGVGTTSALDTAVSNFEGDGGMGGINLANMGDITIGNVAQSTINGAFATNASVTIDAASSITVVTPINAAGGNVTLSATDDVTINANVTTNSSGTIDVSAGRAIGLDSATVSAVNGDITFDANQGVTPTGGSFIGIRVFLSDVTTTGSGDITLRGRGGDTGSQNHGIRGVFGEVRSTATGPTAGTINLIGTAGNGTTDNYGVNLTGNTTRITSVDGDINVTATGDGSGLGNRGLEMQGAARIESTGTGSDASKITIFATGGNGTRANYGLQVVGIDTKITSIDGDIDITGIGQGSDDINYGVNVGSSGVIESTGTGGGAATITINGTGGNGTDGNSGVHVSTGTVTSIDGNIEITGTASGSNPNPNTNVGIELRGFGVVESTGSANLTLTGTPAFATGNGIAINNDATVGAAGGIGSTTLNTDTLAITNANVVVQGSGDLAIQPVTASTTIGLGGGAGTLNIDDSELATLQDGFSSITIGHTAAAVAARGNIDIDTATFLDPVTIAGKTINDGAGTDISAGTNSVTLDGIVSPGQSPGILIVTGNFAFADGDTYDAEIGGATAGTGFGFHDQIDVIGAVTIGNNVTLNLATFGGYVPQDGDVYIIVNNDGTDAVSGTFDSLPEGFLYANFFGTNLTATLSYAGGTGNDVTLSIRCGLTVTHTGDSGFGSLREAINCANSTPGLDTIDFNIPGIGPHTIQPLSALPVVTDAAIIDGYTQTGASVNTNPPSSGTNAVLQVEIDGSLAGAGSDGLTVTSGGTTVRGLVINRFLGSGVVLTGGDSNIIEGNFVGTGINGALALGNLGASGVLVTGSSDNNTIGGATPSSRNLISGNALAGVVLGGADNVLAGNFIGTDASGAAPIANGGDGVHVTSSAQSNRLGGTLAAEANLIAFNALNGVRVDSGAISARIQQNSIHSNVELGIDLGNDGVTLNDPGDGDSGANNLQNFPVLTSVISVAGNTTITGSLNSTPNTTFTLEFFTNIVADPSGFGEGQTFIDWTNVTTDFGGNVSFVVNFAAAIPAGQFMSATTTDPANNTSEFSGVEVVIENLPPVADADGPYMVDEGSSILLDGSGSFDPNDSIDDYEWDFDYDGFTFDIDAIGVAPTFYALLLDGPDSRVIGLRVRDTFGAESDVDTTALTIKNVAPTIDSIVSPDFANKGLEGSEITVSGTFSDPGVPDTHTAEIDWGDGDPVEMMSVDQGNDEFEGQHTYDEGGIYTITVTITDDDGGVDVRTFTAVITGIGLDTTTGILSIIGTLNDDHVSVNKQGNGLLKIHADFLPSGNFRTVNLDDVAKIIAYLCEGDDHLTIAGNIDLPAIIHGGGGDDHLVAGGGGTVLLGDAGDDMLIGGSGFDILVGGFGADRIVGGKGEDILIGGHTVYDNDDDALMALLAEWDDASLPYAARVDNLRNGSGASGLKLVKGDTVLDDGELDRLTGSSDLDWFFFALLEDDATDKKNSEESN